MIKQYLMKSYILYMFTTFVYHVHSVNLICNGDFETYTLSSSTSFDGVT